eukprot:6190578-Alexandrium_andersonii.AAC.1
MESFGGSKGSVHQDDSPRQPAGHSQEAEAIDELARARQGANPLLEGGGWPSVLGALRGGRVGLPGLAVRFAKLLGGHVRLNDGVQALAQDGRRREEASWRGALH